MADGIEITSRQELGAWLEKKPREWAQVIAMRAAMRILPVISRVHGYKISSNYKDRLTLATCHACLISWVARKYPAYDMINAADVADVADAIYTDAAAVVYATVSAAYAAYAAIAADATALAAHAAAKAAAHAADAAAHAAADCWEAVTLDVRRLENGSRDMNEGDAVQGLAGLQLWREGEPKWIVRERQRLFSLPYDNFQVWQHWYERVLTGKSPFGFGAERDENLVVKIALQDGDFWDREFDAVNNDMHEWIEQARVEYAAENSANETPPEPEPGPGPQYGPKDGQLAGHGEPPQEDEASAQARLHELMRKAIFDLAGEAGDSLHNSHPGLASAIHEYSQLLDVDILQLDVTALWSVGGAIAAFEVAYQPQNLSGTMGQPLEPGFAGKLQAGMRQHGAFMMGFEEARDLINRADEFALDTARLNEIEKPGNELLAGLTDDHELVKPETRKLHQPVLDNVQELGWATSRTGYAAYLIVRNGVRALIKYSVGKEPTVASILGLLGGGSFVAGDMDGQFIRQAFQYLQFYGPQLLAFFKHSPEMHSYVQWMLHILEKVEKLRNVDKGDS